MADMMKHAVAGKAPIPAAMKSRAIISTTGMIPVLQQMVNSWMKIPYITEDTFSTGKNKSLRT